MVRSVTAMHELCGIIDRGCCCHALFLQVC